MTPPAVGLGTLTRLGTAVAGPQVLSVYLDVRSGQVNACQRQFEELAADLPHSLDQATSECAHSLICCDSTLAYGTRAIALFVSVGGLTQAMVPLPAPVEPMAVLECIPWLEPLTGMLTSGGWGAAIVSSQTAQLFRGGEAGLVEFAFLGEQIGRRRGVETACSPSLAGGRVQEHGLEHARRLVGMLARAHRRRPFERIAIAAPRGLWPSIEHQLDDALHKQLVGMLATGRAVDGELREAIASTLAHAQSGRNRSCGRFSATPLPEPATSVSQTNARLLPRLPQGQIA